MSRFHRLGVWEYSIVTCSMHVKEVPRVVDNSVLVTAFGVEFGVFHACS